MPVVAIDLPTGVSADSHELEGEAIEASMTVTLAAPKIPLILPPADAYGGDLVIADIGIPAAVIDELDGPWLELLTRERMRELVPARAADSHKGDFGRVLVIAGSVGRTGAAHLSATGRAAIGRGPRDDRDAALVRADRRRDGAGIHDASRSRKPPPAPSTSARADRVLDFKADVIAIGPGLGQDPSHGGVRPGDRRARRACRSSSTPTR